MTVFASDLLGEIQQRLGDSSAQIWTAAELEQYISDGYDLLTKQTGCLFGVELSPDYAFAFNFTAGFEFEFAISVSGWYADGPASFTSQFERDYIDNAMGPANHNEHWEYNQGYQTQTGQIAEVSPLINLPDNLQEIERVTWNTRHAAALMSRDNESLDQRYEINKGIVEGYFRDKDGLGKLRKWRVPSSPYVVYKFDDLTSPL